MVAHVLGDAGVVAARQHELDVLTGFGREAGEGADGEGDVLLALEAVDAEEQLLALPPPLLLLDVDLDRSVDTGVYDLEVLLARQRGPGAADDAFRKVGVDGDGIGEAHAPLLPPVEWEAVRTLPPFLAALGEEEVREVAVEEDAALGVEVL